MVVKLWAAPVHGTLSRSGTPLAANDTFTGSPKTLTYTPDGNYNGRSEERRVGKESRSRWSPYDSKNNCDAASRSSEVTVPITGSPVNDKPSAAASPASLSLNEDGSTTVDVSGSDVETAAAALVHTLTAAPAHGTLSRSGTPLAANDTFTGSPKTLTYTPDGNYNG